MKRYTLYYSLLNITYYMLGSAVLGFEGFYLSKIGISASTIGIVLSAAGIVSVLFQPLTGRFCDNVKRFDMRHVIFAIIVASVLVGMASFFSKSTVLLVILFCLLIVLIYQAMGLLNSLCMLIENQGKKINYGLARGLGSVSYALTALVIGYYSEEVNFGHSFIINSVVVSGIVTLLSLLPFLFDKSLSRENSVAAENYKKTRVVDFLREYPHFFFLCCCVSIIFTAHNILSIFTYQLISPMGHASKEVGLIICIYAGIELPGMLLCSHLLKKNSPGKIMAISGFFFLLKAVFCLIGVATSNFYVFFAGQFFQFAGNGFFAPASVYYTNSVISQDSLSSGQAVMTATNVLGCVLGSIIGGISLDLLGTTGMMEITVGLCLLGCILVCVLLKEKKSPQK